MQEFIQLFTEVQFFPPSTGSIVAIVLACLLLVVSGFASGSEIAFFSLSPTDLNELEESKDQRDQRIMAVTISLPTWFVSEMYGLSLYASLFC